MAVLSEVPGLTVTVDVAGEDLAEYDDDESDKPEPRTATKYVEAHSGANFGIATRIDAATFAHPSDTIRLKMYLDGNFVSAWSLKQETLSRGRRTVMNYTGQIDGDREIRMKFSFAELQTNEGPVDEALWGKLGDLGTITALYFRYRAENVTQAPQTGYSNEAAAGTMYPDHWPTREAKNGNRPGAKFPTCAIENDVVPEKNLKGRAISHQAKIHVAEERPLRPETLSNANTRNVYTDGQRLATFNFKYRSRNALQSALIIPRTPSPVPLTVPSPVMLKTPSPGPLEDRPIKILTPEDIRQSLAGQKERTTREADFAKIKKEKKCKRDDHDDAECADDFEVVESRPLIPRTSSPVPLKTRPIEDRTPDGMRELLARLRDKMSHGADPVKVKEKKRERDEHDNEGRIDGSEVADSKSRKSCKREPAGSVEVIDLCDED